MKNPKMPGAPKMKNTDALASTGYVPAKEKTGCGGTHTPATNSPHNARPSTPTHEVSNGEHFHKLGQ